MNGHERKEIWMGGERGSQTRDRRGAGCRASFAALVGCLLALVMAPAAQALPTDLFSPTLQVVTSTSKAGAHPILTIEMHRQRNGCYQPGLPAFQIAPFASCPLPDFYMQQDLKKEAVHLPAGLMGDANAAPYCDPYEDEAYTWFCANPDALVGTVYIIPTSCNLEPDGTGGSCINTTKTDTAPGANLPAAGAVYNARPGPGEQAHLVVLWPTPMFPQTLKQGAWQKSDISVAVRQSDTGLDAVADNLPDVIHQYGGAVHGGADFSGQISDLWMTLDGSTGTESGHPLLTNPTFCGPQAVDAEFQGYGNNSVDPGYGDPTNNAWTQGDGDGKTVSDSAPYQATGCDSVPYDPKLSLSLDTTAPDKPAAISSTVTQAQGEATSKKVTVSFPKAFKINAQNKSTFCSDADLAASTCPDSSKVGTVTADSPLLPIGQSLSGGVYLAGLSGDSIKISALLSGFISLRIDATAKLALDGSLVTTFDNLPAVPIGQLKLNLEGGDRGLIKTPKVCAPQTVTSTFQSHSGKTSTISSPIDIAGCQGPTLDATLTSRKPGAATNLELDVRSLGTKLKSVEFIPSRQLHWGIPKRAQSAKAKATSVGKVAFTTASGELATAFKAARVRNDGVDLVAVAPRSAQGTVSELAGFGANLSRTKTGSPLKRKALRRSKQAVPQSHLALNGLPQNDLTGIDLTLNSKRKLFTLHNPLGCKHPLNFVALATAVDGTQFAVSDRVKLRGRGCRR